MEDKQDNWPKHPNGKRKKMGELTKEQQKVILKGVCADIKRDLEQPHVQAAFKKVLEDQT